MTSRQAAGRPERRTGAAAVELAVLLPILAILLLGLWELGRLIWVQQVLSNAAREGARQAAAGEKSPNQVRHHIRTYLQRAGLSTEGMPDPEVDNLTDPNRADPRNGRHLDRYKVRITFPVANYRWVALHYLSDTLTAESTFACIADVPVGTPSEEIP
jgi:Flp pilus assembly protein TadG